MTPPLGARNAMCFPSGLTAAAVLTGAPNSSLRAIRPSPAIAGNAKAHTNVITNIGM
jgi:hypothetical protein